VTFIDFKFSVTIEYDNLFEDSSKKIHPVNNINDKQAKVIINRSLLII